MVMVAIGWGGFDCREGEGVGDFEGRIFVHTHKEASHWGGEGLRAVSYDLHHHLEFLSTANGKLCLDKTYQCFHLDCIERRIFPDIMSVDSRCAWATNIHCFY